MVFPPQFPPAADPPPVACVLVLDMPPAFAALLPTDSLLVQARFEDLDAALLARLAPDRILLPLIGTNPDALQIIERLEALGYQGAITVIGPALPKPRLVERELRALGPGNRLTLVSP